MGCYTYAPLKFARLVRDCPVSWFWVLVNFASHETLNHSVVSLFSINQVHVFYLLFFSVQIWNSCGLHLHKCLIVYFICWLNSSFRPRGLSAGQFFVLPSLPSFLPHSFTIFGFARAPSGSRCACRSKNQQHYRCLIPVCSFSFLAGSDSPAACERAASPVLRFY
jgi:hypothetical protein